MKASAFEFKSAQFSLQKRQAVFSYTIHFEGHKPMTFKDTLFFPKQKTQKLPTPLLKELLKNLHLVLGLSYYKLYCPPTLKLPYKLTSEEAIFWNTLYEKGLGEFFFRNKIDFRGLITFPSRKTAKPFAPVRLPTQERALLGVGGGKDSIVAGEFLKARKLPLTAFVLETERASPIVEEVISAMGLKALVVHRKLDPKVILPKADLEKILPGALNGHIPISAIFAFVGLFTSALYGYRYTVVGNEASSNFGNVRYLGTEINHQWSKSAEFEALLQAHTRSALTPDLSYFSAIRHLYEIRVVEEFVKHPKYFPIFASCNRSFRVSKDRPSTRWCGECAKCAFVFAELSAFLTPIQLTKIFGKNLFEDPALLPLFKDLCELGTMKPFDCVGTFEETRCALRRAEKNFGETKVLKELTPLLQKAFPKEETGHLFQVQSAPTLPAHFKFLGLKNVLLLGYGKEGKVTEKYLKKFYPDLAILIADQAKDPHYLDLQKTAEFAVKTPGLPKQNVSLPYATATQIFFTQNRNVTIGVTGSKGKSTTASLIAHILKKTQVPVKLLGNIGSPMLEVLLKKNNPKTIYVLELSSYQLDELQTSPDVAVITNLFPEHMNYHGGIVPYYEAKKNLIRTQSPAQIFVCNTAHSQLKKWSKETKATSIPFSPWTPQKSPLLGEHNRSNLAGAISAVQALVQKLGRAPLSKKTLEKAVASFEPLRHRLQKIGTFNGIHFYDDAISTSPESTIEALKALSPLAPIGTLFLGGEDRGYDFTELEKELRKRKIPNLVLFPDTGKRMLATRKGFTIFEAKSLKEAVTFAKAHTPKGQICLLSTASPHTFGMSFEEKGDEFARLVRELGLTK